MRAHSLISLFLSALALSSCNGVPIATQWKLRNFDLGAADVSKVRAALRTPNWLVPTPDKSVLVVRLAPRDGNGDEQKIELRLQRAVHPDDARAIASISSKAGPLAFYEVSSRDLAAARAAQDEAQRLKRDDGAKHAKLSVERGVACRRGPVPEGPIPVDLFIHTDDETGWLPVFDEFDLRALLKTPEDLRKFEEGAPLCDQRRLTRPASASESAFTPKIERRG